jgi:hypothetical protein
MLALTQGMMSLAPAGGGGVSARRWRFLATLLDGAGSAFSCAELGMRSVAGGPSIAVGGTASANSVFGSLVPAQAFDGNPSTIWGGASGSSVPAWLAYDFGSPVSIVEVAYTGRPDGLFGQYPRDFSIQHSDDDGASWTTLWSVSGQSWTVAGETRVFTRP